MEHLGVRFSRDLPYRIERLEDQSSFFLIPKAKRLKTLRFMERRPQHIIRKRRSSWEVMGTFPKMRQRGGNSYSTYLREVKKVLSRIPDHPLSKLPLVQLQKQPQVKDLYDKHFKNNPDLLNAQSIVNTVASSLLDYDNSTGAVRDSVADVRMKSQLPTTTAPSLQVTRENEFDRILLLVFDRYLAEKNIPELFLKSNYFTLRPQLLQVYHTDDGGFRARVEQARGVAELQIARDYANLVNETNRMYLARYPFEEIAKKIGIKPTIPEFTLSENKLIQIKQRTLTIRRSSQKFTGLEELTQTYASSPESQFITVQHFMHGLQDKMTSDTDFVQTVLKNRSRSHGIVLTILDGKSFP